MIIFKKVLYESRCWSLTQDAHAKTYCSSSFSTFTDSTLGWKSRRRGTKLLTKWSTKAIDFNLSYICFSPFSYRQQIYIYIFSSFSCKHISSGIMFQGTDQLMEWIDAICLGSPLLKSLLGCLPCFPQQTDLEEDHGVEGGDRGIIQNRTAQKHFRQCIRIP